MITLIKNHWQHIAASLIALCLAFYIVSCEPTTQSLITPGEKVNRKQLQLELQALQAKFTLRSQELEYQERIRKIIMQNALLIAQTQNINPIGIITGLASLYGIASAARDGTRIVKKRKPTPLPARQPDSNHSA